MEKEEDDLLARPTCAPHYYRVVMQKSKEEGARFERRTPSFQRAAPRDAWQVN